MPRTLIIFRNGQTDLAARLAAAVAAFRQDRGHAPLAVTVHKTEVTAAQAAVGALGLELEVRGTGGCLISEVWLQATAEKKEGNDG